MLYFRFLHETDEVEEDILLYYRRPLTSETKLVSGYPVEDISQPHLAFGVFLGGVPNNC